VEELQGVVDDNISLFANGPLSQRRLRLFCRPRAVLYIDQLDTRARYLLPAAAKSFRMSTRRLILPR
jgi:hypothetical protein